MESTGLEMSAEGKKTYVSCIKINGKPILPPVITRELRKELLKYKHQAIKLEQRLKNCRELKKHLDELLDTQNETPRPSPVFTLDDNSHIEALNISDARNVQHEGKKCNLRRDIIEVTQYDDSGMKTICVSDLTDNVGKNEPCDNGKTDLSVNEEVKGALNITIDQHITLNNSGKKYQSCDNEFHKPLTPPPKPRLIRSNSYTLDGPSPILLAHLKKTSCTQGKNGGSDLASARNWTSLENNHTPPFESSDFSSIDTVYHNENCDKSNRSEVASSPDRSAKTIHEEKSPTIEVYQTDISVQQITVNTNGTAQNGLTKEEKTEKFLSRNPFDVFEPDSDLLNVLKDIPEVYANQIIELLRAQHVEQKERLERYDKLGGSPEKLSLNHEYVRSQNLNDKTKENNSQSTPLNSGNSPTKIPEPCDNLLDLTSKINKTLIEPPMENNENPDRPYTTESSTNSDKPLSERLTRSSTFSMSPSQSLYYSITSDVETVTPPSSPSVKVIDLESNNGDEMEIGVLREKNGYWEGVMLHENTKNLNCSRELFPKIDSGAVKALKREWAASVIGAYAKGYLTRRLLKTEKVQGFIATIKDVLMCAIDLQRSDNIDEKDVELHRRLINQLSAALYSFHETFFDLPTSEQMLIIAADRHRKIEKLKRPQSRPQSGRTRSLSNKGMNSSKLNKSLPSSRSSSKHTLISGSPSLTKV